MANISKNLPAFLDCIAWAELGSELLAQSDNGYNVLVGSRPGHVNRFFGYEDHPRQLITVSMHKPDGTPVTLQSTAAGRYQILARYFDVYRKQLKLPDFGPVSQDAIAIQMIKECGALADIEAGRFEVAVMKCRSRWASFPGSGNSQPEHTMGDLRAAYVAAGGALAA